MMFTVPVNVPAVEGEKVTFTTQVARGAMVPHEVEAAKLAVADGASTIKLSVPQLVICTGWLPEVVPTGWLPKLMLLRSRQTAGAVAVPVPVNATNVGLEAAFEATDIVAERAPAAPGVKVTLMGHEPPAAIDSGHVLVCEKSVGLVPVKLTELKLQISLSIFSNTG